MIVDWDLDGCNPPGTFCENRVWDDKSGAENV